MIAAVLVSCLSASPTDATVDKAQQVLTAARTAAGLADVRSLSLKADVRRVMPGPDGTPGEMSGEVRVDVLHPGRYKHAESLSPMPGMPPFTLVYGLDGEAAWTERPPASHGSGMVVMRMRPGGEGPASEEALRRRLRADYARLALAALLATDAAMPLDVRHVAVAEAPEGKADVLEVTGADGFAARLFVDTATHRPLMLTYRDHRPRTIMRRLEGPPPAGDQAAPPPLDQRPAEPPAEDVTLHLDDFRQVRGVRLPHRLTVSISGTPAEEWTVTEYKLNPPLGPSVFRKK
jgi:hypothetical protein